MLNYERRQKVNGQKQFKDWEDIFKLENQPMLTSWSSTIIFHLSDNLREWKHDAAGSRKPKKYTNLQNQGLGNNSATDQPTDDTTDISLKSKSQSSAAA